MFTKQNGLVHFTSQICFQSTSRTTKTKLILKMEIYRPLSFYKQCCLTDFYFPPLHQLVSHQKAEFPMMHITTSTTTFWIKYEKISPNSNYVFFSSSRLSTPEFAVSRSCLNSMLQLTSATAGNMPKKNIQNGAGWQSVSTRRIGKTLLWNHQPDRFVLDTI